MKKVSFMVGEIHPPSHFGICRNGEHLTPYQLCHLLIEMQDIIDPIMNLCEDYNLTINDIIKIVENTINED